MTKRYTPVSMDRNQKIHLHPSSWLNAPAMTGPKLGAALVLMVFGKHSTSFGHESKHLQYQQPANIGSALAGRGDVGQDPIRGAISACIASQGCMGVDSGVLQYLPEEPALCTIRRTRRPA